MQQRTTDDGCPSFGDRRRIFYRDALLVVADHGDEKLTDFMKKNETFFTGHLKSNKVSGPEVVDIVQAYSEFPAGLSLKHGPNANRSMQAKGMSGAAAVEASAPATENRGVRPEREEVMRQVTLEMRKAFNAKNISAWALQRQVVTLICRAMGNYDQRLEIERRFLHPPRLQRVENPEAPTGWEWRTFREINKYGIQTWLFECQGFKVEWKVIDRALKNLRKHYNRLAGGGEQTKKTTD